ncbi:hypothetical protein [Natronolimnohabitans innermongolicus]|uniref:hypothetical protein n=1 Tax=Natronolimnohabitans innermongolicus TaxID=253107 RepID=UPI0019D32492|nr:hypothetical protein [Natronolimnohabitans innermongolicus]
MNRLDAREWLHSSSSSNTERDEPLTVGVLVNPRVPAWHERAIENVRALDGVRVNYAVVNAEQSSMLSDGADAINRDGLFSLDDLKLFYRVVSEDGLKAALYADQKLGWDVFGETRQRELLRSKPIDDVDCLADVDREDCVPESDGAWKTLPDETVETLGQRCDVVLRFGFGLIKGDVLTAPEHGVLSVHGSDIRKSRGMGPQIAFLHDNEHVTVTLQQLSEEIDAGSIVEMTSTDVPTHATYDDVSGEILRLSSAVYADGVRNLRDGNSPWDPETVGTYYSLELQRKSPRFVGTLLLKNNYRRLRKSVA